MVLPSCCLAGRSALPLDPGDGGHRGMPTGRQGQATEPTKSAMDQLAGRGWLRCRVGWWGACGWGSGMPGTVRPDPSTLGAVGERGSRRESCLQLVPGSAGQALDLLQMRCWDALGGPLEQRAGRVVRQDDGADIGEALLEVVVLEALVGRPDVDP